MGRWGLFTLFVACGDDEPTTGETGTPVDLGPCQASEAPEVFLGRGVGGAFVPIQDGDELGLTAAPQGGFGVSVLVGTRGMQAGVDQVASATLTASSAAVETSSATFTLYAALECKTDGPDGAQGVIYGVVVGFASSLSNSDLLAMNGQPADLVVEVTDSAGHTASVTQTVTLVVGE